MEIRDKVVIITGASGGIGQAAALAFGHSGAKVVLVARRSEILQEIASKMNNTLVITADLSKEEDCLGMIEQTISRFQRIDILINNASAINLTPTEKTPAKRFDLMLDVNVRGTFLASQAAIPHLRKSAQEGRNPHILTLSPPLSMNPKWFKPHVAYTISK